MNKILELQAKKYAIETSGDLSSEGKKKAMDALNREIEVTRGAMARELSTSWGALKSKMTTNIERVQAAEAKAAERWDYSRLNYMTQAVKSQVNSAANFEAVKGLYDAAKNNGDNHARRVWCEVIQEHVATKYRTGEGVALSKQLQAELDSVLTTPELDAARSEGSDLTRQAAALDVLTKQANGYFYGGQLGVNMIYGVKTAFETMTEGLQINQRVDAESLATITTVELVD